MDAPEFTFAGFIAKRLEGDRHLDDVAIGSNQALRLHYDIYTEVVIASFGKESIHLDAERIEEQLISASLVVKCIQNQTDNIIVEDGIAFRYAGAHFGRLVVSVKCEVKKTRVVPGEDLRSGRCWRGVAGSPLIEILENRGRLPGFIIEIAIDYGRLSEKGYFQSFRFLRGNHLCRTLFSSYERTSGTRIGGYCRNRRRTGGRTGAIRLCKREHREQRQCAKKHERFD